MNYKSHQASIVIEEELPNVAILDLDHRIRDLVQNNSSVTHRLFANSTRVCLFVS